MSSSTEVNNPYLIEEELHGMIKEVRDYNINQGVCNGRIIPADVFKKRMETSYEYLFKSSPGLFDKCLANEFRNKQNVKRIEEMLHHLKNIYNGKVKKEAVDQHLGSKYAKEYVDPLVNKLDSSTKKN